MPTVTGTSVKGRQVLASSLTAATTAFLRVTGSQATVYERVCFLTWEQVQGGVVYAGERVGNNLWYSGLLLTVPSITSPNSRNITAFWVRAGIPWSLTY